MLFKHCDGCRKKFFKPYNCSLKNWKISKYCSKECSNKVVAFKKGNDPWNRGTIGVCKENSGSFKKGHSCGHRYLRGHKPWNDGTAKVSKYVCMNCKKEFEVSASVNGNRPRKYCSHECCYSDRKGKNSPSWKGGITSLYDLIRKNNIYKQWTKDIIKRDGYICNKCKKVGGKLEVHHKKDFATIIRENKVKSLEDALTCVELWDHDNGETLCKNCHKLTNNYCGRGIKRPKN